MVLAQRLLPDRECASIGLLRLGELAAHLISDAEVEQALRHLAVVRAKHLLPDHERALQERLRFRELALHLMNDGEVVEAGRHMAMVPT